MNARYCIKLFHDIISCYGYPASNRTTYPINAAQDTNY